MSPGPGTVTLVSLTTRETIVVASSDRKGRVSGRPVRVRGSHKWTLEVDGWKGGPYALSVEDPCSAAVSAPMSGQAEEYRGPGNILTQRLPLFC